MALRNEILLIGSVRIHNRIVERCFCNRCRDLRLETVMNAGLSVGQIRDIFDGELFETENQRLDSLFTNTLDQIVHGKALKEQSLRGTGRKYFGAWAKNQPLFAHLGKKELEKFVDKVNDAANVYNKWDKIVANLTKPWIDQIDARRLSVRQFYLSTSPVWCSTYNNSLRKKGRKENLPDDVPTYTEDKYQEIVQSIINSGILRDLDYDPEGVVRLDLFSLFWHFFVLMSQTCLDTSSIPPLYSLK